ncbi:hypothetical protein E2C01_004044 [Portunus trituberculatus]|uniref:Uncharacterized protein n=1 Tax=Portunus trituberculatus TaxID=210409 RepID=A0A5B7CPH3_PORTR|nr:hypothetical protein [Portunus trituberculatus]
MPDAFGRPSGRRATQAPVGKWHNWYSTRLILSFGFMSDFLGRPRDLLPGLRPLFPSSLATFSSSSSSLPLSISSPSSLERKELSSSLVPAIACDADVGLNHEKF